MLFPAGGAILLWTATIVAAVPPRRTPIARAAAFAALAALALGPAGLFIGEQMRLHSLALGQVWQLANLSALYPDDRHLVINPLDWLASRRPHYALGHESVEVLPAYLPLDGLAAVNSGVPVRMDPVQFSNIRPELAGHWYNVAADDTDWQGLAGRPPDYDRVWLTRYSDKRIDIVAAGRVQAGADSPATLLASFGEAISLTDVGLSVLDGEPQIALTWYAAAPANAEIFRHVLDCGGNVLGLGDGPALGGAYPVWAWRAADRVTDVRRMRLEALSADGCYLVEIGLFNPADGVRLPARDSHGRRLENDAHTFIWCNCSGIHARRAVPGAGNEPPRTAA